MQEKLLRDIYSLVFNDKCFVEVVATTLNTPKNNNGETRYHHPIKNGGQGLPGGSFQDL